jgi:hypothetical protein
VSIGLATADFRFQIQSAFDSIGIRLNRHPTISIPQSAVATPQSTIGSGCLSP